MANRVISQFVKASIWGGIAASATIPAAIAAQNDVERLEVTGSRINRADMETASPVTVIGAEAIQASGYNSVDEVLAAQPAMAGAALGATSNNGSGGKAEVDLRGLGSQRTLVLVNGRRMTNSGTGADSSVDLNSIPVTMISRIEILKDGASAIYGSDAIAGVVNIITKKDFDGFALDVQGGITGEGDGGNTQVSAIYGINTDSGNYTFGASFTDRQAVVQSDRNWAPPGASSFIPKGSLGGKVFDGETGEWNNRDEGYDYSKDSYFQTPSKRYSFYASANQEITDSTSFSADVIYTRRESGQQMAPEPASVMLVTCNATLTQNCVNLTPEMIAGGIEADDKGRVEYRRRMQDVGPRITEQEVDTFRLSAGFNGQLDIHEGLNWDLSYTLGKNDSKDFMKNAIRADRMANSIYNNQDKWLYGGADALTADIVNDISYLQSNNGGNEQHTFQANISGDLFEMAGGYAAFASGFEYRDESGYYNPDQILQQGLGTEPKQAATNGNYQVASAFTEVALPLSDDWSLEAAIRHDNYSTFGGATTWKLGTTYELTDAIKLRGVAATGFRAPNVSELYGGESSSFDYLDDPWGNAEDAQLRVKYTSDPNLKPEESKSLTLGAVISPTSVEGLSFTADYWDYEITNAISRLDTQSYLNKCEDGDTAACEAINVTPEGDLSNLSSPLTNIGQFNTRGIDFNMQYRFSSGDIDWTINNDTTHLLKYEKSGTDLTGVIDGQLGAYARWKNMLRISARSGDWSVSYSERYIGDMQDRSATANNPYTVYVGSASYHNVSATYHFNDELTASFGVKNLTNESPNRVSNGSDADTSPETYDVLGRRFFAGVNLRF
ncbi:TonB-dependent receptor [Paraferrimonas sp. SM1919]|uniref:TonB-dependent receptor n=1 Tax=Paraferrimonas sp. SM1919 TaxID=2662263 RepID=UPI0013D1F9E6|nr:TonB-dependent receptor [Paraferrimonas sp. SM1919]